MENTSIGFFRKAGIALGFIEGPSEVRSELPVMGSTDLPYNVVNLTGTNTTAVSPDRAIGIAAVFRAVDILETSVSQLPVGVWRNGEELEVPTTSIVARPNLDCSRGAFFAQTTVSLATAGNAFWKLTRNSPTAAVTNVEVLNPHNVFIDVENGKTVYRYEGKVFQKWQIKHLFHTRLPGWNRGVGPIQAAQNELRGALDLRNYADQWFSSAGVPNGVLKTDQVLAPTDADAIRARWHATQATNGRDVAVLGQGVSYQPVYLSPADAQFLESQQFSISQVARIFGIPATYLLAGVEGNSMTYTNLEQVDTAFVKYTLMKYLSEIEAALSDLLPRGQEVKFKVEVLLRADLKTRYDAYKTAIEAGFLTANEVRAREGLLPLSAAQAKPAAPVDAGNTNQVGTNA